MRNRKAERNGEENMRYSTVFFDLDGTLTDSAEGILNSLEYALRSMTGTVPPRKELYAFIGPPLLDAFRERLGMSEEEAARALLLYREYYLSRGIRENRLIDGAVELLTRLHRAGFRLAVATSKPEPQAEQILREFSVDGYFALVAGSTPDQSRARKEDVLRDALHRLGNPDPRSCLMIGDRFYDVEGARACGMDTLGVLCGYGSEKELCQAGAIAVVRDLASAGDFLMGADVGAKRNAGCT